MMSIYKKVAFIGLLALVFVSISAKPAQAATTALSGWAWSSNVGWISFNSNDSNAGGGPYAVTVSTSTGSVGDSIGTLNGFAWSPAIGWIKFGGLSSYPDNASTDENAKIDFTSGAVTGWIRACTGTLDGQCAAMNSRSDGWDGWISLSGTNYASPTADGSGGVTLIPSTGALTGYAWGSDVVGWINFNVATAADGSTVNPVCVGVCNPSGSGFTLEIKDGLTNAYNSTTPASPISVYQGNASNIRWSTTGANSCQTSNGNWSEGINKSVATNSSGESTGVFNTLGNTQMTMSCTIGFSQKVKTVYINVIPVVTPPPPSTITCTVPPHADMCPTSTQTANYGTLGAPLRTAASQCQSASLSVPLYCENACQAGYTIIGNSCSKSKETEL